MTINLSPIPSMCCHQVFFSEEMLFSWPMNWVKSVLFSCIDTKKGVTAVKYKTSLQRNSYVVIFIVSVPSYGCNNVVFFSCFAQLQNPYCVFFCSLHPTNFDLQMKYCKSCYVISSQSIPQWRGVIFLLVWPLITFTLKTWYWFGLHKTSFPVAIFTVQWECWA